MSITRRVTYKLYPSRCQDAKMHYWRRLHASLYNAAVYNRKTQYQKFGHSVNYLEQQNSLPEFKKVWPEYKELGSHALQATLKRVDLAFNRLFKGLGGYPKFKASRRYSGWTYVRYCFVTGVGMPPSQFNVSPNAKPEQVLLVLT